MLYNAEILSSEGSAVQRSEFGCMLAEAETEDWEDGVSLSLSNVCFADLQSCHQNTLRYLISLEKKALELAPF